MKLNIIPLIAFALIAFSSSSCRHRAAKKEMNISSTISTDTAKLGTLINFSIYHPTHVKFKYTFIDNSGSNKRLSVPGPSDYYLDALLYFDSASFIKLKRAYYNFDYISPSYSKTDFAFNWLDHQTQFELENSDTAYHGHPDFFFRPNGNSRLWLLDGKVLFRSSSQ